jgi:hypothetical protein
MKNKFVSFLSLLISLLFICFGGYLIYNFPLLGLIIATFPLLFLGTIIYIVCGMLLGGKSWIDDTKNNGNWKITLKKKGD